MAMTAGKCLGNILQSFTGNFKISLGLNNSRMDMETSIKQKKKKKFFTITGVWYCSWFIFLEKKIWMKN